MILPTIHTNGTNPHDLLAGYRAAMEAVSVSMKALADIEFNARDYYVQGPQAWTQAQAARESMFTQLGSVYSDLMSHAIHINDATITRDARRADQAQRRPHEVRGSCASNACFGAY